MRFYIVIPAHNEEDYLAKTLESLKNQSHEAAKIVVVDDNSDDNTSDIIERFKDEIPYLSSVHLESSSDHAPGGKVIRAFNAGLETLDENYDVLCKFDADLVFPENYLETLQDLFSLKSKCGMAGGFCYIEKNGDWQLESLTSKDHIRGALKSYRKSCFKDISGLKESMGWDTVDEMLARFHNWEVNTLEELKVLHLKPTASRYRKGNGTIQGKAFRRMRYGFFLTAIASLKLALKKSSLLYFFECMKGFFQKPAEYIVSLEEGRFIRKYRWKGIWSKLS